MMKNFEDKVVAITGAGSGMGRAYALEFGRLGAKLALNDWNEQNLLETKNLAHNEGVKAIHFKAFDVSNKVEMFTFAEEVKNALGNTHIIINNAGIGGNGDPFYKGDIEMFDRVLNINLYGVINGCRAFLPHIIENNEGAVVNVASILGLVGAPSVSAYCTSKFAVRGFSESLMVEFHKSPISIHCVMPGGINTAIADDAPNAEEFKKSLKTPPEEVARYLVKCIKAKKPDVLCGYDSSRVNFISKYFPLKWRNKIFWKRMTKMGLSNQYKPFNSLMN